jgi:GNAT superfamily N-acetyltransferase
MTKTPVTHTVADKDGRPYELTIETIGHMLFLRLRHQGEQVGHAQCVRDGDSLCLGDLMINKPTQAGLLGSLERKLKGQLSDYRGRGLGTILLQQVLSTAKETGVKEIHGSIVQDDIDTTPHLLDWYKRYGFRVEKPTEQDAKSAIARIQLEIS